MPAQPAWFHRLDRILEELHALPCPFLDRHAVQKLFGVGERRARQFIQDLPALRFGNALAVERAALIAKLEGVEQSDEYTRERPREERVAAHLDRLRKHLPARRIRLPGNPGVHSKAPGDLPSAIEIAPGELRVRFQGAEDLAAQLFTLAQAMANDWSAFQKAADGAVPRPARTPLPL